MELTEANLVTEHFHVFISFSKLTKTMFAGKKERLESDGIFSFHVHVMSAIDIPEIRHTYSVIIVFSAANRQSGFSLHCVR